jgi:hypothetical protein
MFRFSVVGFGLLVIACGNAPAPAPSTGAPAKPFLTEIVLHDGPTRDWPGGSQEYFGPLAIDAEAVLVRGEGEPP